GELDVVARRGFLRTVAHDGPERVAGCFVGDEGDGVFRRTGTAPATTLVAVFFGLTPARAAACGQQREACQAREHAVCTAVSSRHGGSPHSPVNGYHCDGS